MKKKKPLRKIQSVPYTPPQKPPHGNIKCDCHHTQKHHYCGEGFCQECGCTWYHPNVDYVLETHKRMIRELFKKLGMTIDSITIHKRKPIHKSKVSVQAHHDWR